MKVMQVDWAIFMYESALEPLCAERLAFDLNVGMVRPDRSKIWMMNRISRWASKRLTPAHNRVLYELMDRCNHLLTLELYIGMKICSPCRAIMAVCQDIKIVICTRIKFHQKNIRKFGGYREWQYRGFVALLWIWSAQKSRFYWLYIFSIASAIRQLSPPSKIRRKS